MRATTGNPSSRPGGLIRAAVPPTLKPVVKPIRKPVVLSIVAEAFIAITVASSVQS